MDIDTPTQPTASSSKPSAPGKSAIKSLLSTLASRQSKGTTSDPSSLSLVNPTLSLPSTLKPHLPITDAEGVEAPAEKKKGGKQKSARQKRREGKVKEKAVQLGGKLEVKVKVREGKKARRDRAKKAWE